MTERIAFKVGDAIYFTEGTVESVCEDLNEGRQVTVYGYNPNGHRWQETMIFYGQPEWVATDRT